jgi:hypothetical protein
MLCRLFRGDHAYKREAECRPQDANGGTTKITTD